MPTHIQRECAIAGAKRRRREFLSTAYCFAPWLMLDDSHAVLQVTGEQRRRPLFKTEDRVALALMLFREGFHCSQSVLEAYAEDFGLEPELARRMAAGLVGGSTVGGECGVVGSGYLVLGLKYAGLLPAHGNVEREERLWSRVRRFLAEFKNRNGAVTCRDLLGVDVFTKEGREEALRRNLFATRCRNHIRNGIEISDSLD